MKVGTCAVLWSLGLLTGISACSASDKDETGADNADGDDDEQVAIPEVVEIFSWWTQPGEAEALQALIDVYKDDTQGGRVFNAAAESGADSRAILADRLDAGDPPDLFQENASQLSTFVDSHPNGLVALDDLFEDDGLMDAVFPEVIENVTVGRKIVAMPVNLHRENAVFYNIELFDRHDIEPPETLDELLLACETLDAAGVVPIATSHQGWIQRIMFNSIVMGSMGGVQFYDYFSGVGARDNPALRQAISVFDTILTEYTNDDAGDEDFGWTEAAQAVHDGRAAMFLHGDWAKGYFEQLGWDPGVDFGTFGAPGAADLFLYGVDVFALPVGAKNEAGALEFLSSIGSEAGQIAFNAIKGSSPIRLDVPHSQLDPVAQVTLTDLENADVRMLVKTRDEWDAALAAFAVDHDAEALVQAFVDNVP